MGTDHLFGFAWISVTNFTGGMRGKT